MYYTPGNTETPRRRWARCGNSYKTQHLLAGTEGISRNLVMYRNHKFAYLSSILYNSRFENTNSLGWRGWCRNTKERANRHTGWEQRQNSHRVPQVPRSSQSNSQHLHCQFITIYRRQKMILEMIYALVSSNLICKKGKAKMSTDWKQRQHWEAGMLLQGWPQLKTLHTSWGLPRMIEQVVAQVSCY